MLAESAEFRSLLCSAEKKMVFMIKNALITGASSGVGKSIALELGRYCSSLALHYHRNLGEAKSIQETLSSKNCRCKLFCYDLTDSEKAKMMVSRAADELGGLDALINVIGPFSYSEIGDVTCQEWEKTIALNLHTCYHVTRHALPHLIHSRGHIVNFAFSGVEDLKAWPMSTAYCVSKAGIVILTKSLAASLAPKGVRVNAICPGLVEEEAATEAERIEMSRQIPWGRPVRPHEIAETVRWLLLESPESVTGSLIPVAGAWEY